MAILFLIVNIKNRTQNRETLTLRTAFGDKGPGCRHVSVIVDFAIWSNLILPLALLLSILSPVGRQSWYDGKFSYAIASMLVVLLLGGLVPTSNPKALQDWESLCFMKILTHHSTPQANSILG